jgi:hypothetical protein
MSAQDPRLGAGNKGSKYTSNKTHYSPTDPDAKISVKQGKARKLNYLSQMTVDRTSTVLGTSENQHKRTSQIAIKRCQVMLTTVLASVKVDVVLNQWEIKR